jgi:hypothetical protein
VTLLRDFARRLLLAAALLAGLVVGGWLAAGAMTTAPAAGVPARHCEARDLGAYTGVVVGPDPAHTRYVHTGHRLADGDPRWRGWGRLWKTCDDEEERP